MLACAVYVEGDAGVVGGECEGRGEKNGGVCLSTARRVNISTEGTDSVVCVLRPRLEHLILNPPNLPPKSTGHIVFLASSTPL